MNIFSYLIAIEVVCLALMILSGLSHKFELLGFKPAFGAFALSGLVIVVCFLIALVLLILSLARVLSLPNGPGGIALLIGIAPIICLLLYLGPDQLKAPRIHNITTDLENPPLFEKVPELRKPSENSSAPPSEKVIALQKSHYQLSTLTLGVAKTEVFKQALELVDEFGWQLINQNADKGLIEATDETALFGFKDDIVVRINQIDDSKSAVDLRSVSRVGVGDLGANAKRIESFLQALSAKVSANAS